MNIALWIIAGLLAAACLGGGLMLLRPKEKLVAAGWAWVEDFSAGTVRTKGGNR
jgi:hypothetical protein